MDFFTRLLCLLKMHSPDMFDHSVRTGVFSMLIAESLGLSQNEMNNCFYAGVLHDIGKCHIPDTYLSTMVKLDYVGYEVVKNHVQFGIKMLQEDTPLYIVDSVMYHHEKYNGEGYPYGLSGEEIPLVARIVALADAYDAMTSNRQYQSHKTLETAAIEILNCRGVQFCPKVVDAFMKTAPKLQYSKNAIIDDVLNIPIFLSVKNIYELKTA